MLASDALSRGYFPAELPPPFNSSDFANASSGLTAAASVPKSEKWTAPVTLNLARPGSLRRKLSIPNPFSQLELVKECEKQWATLHAHMNLSKISLSRPVPAKVGRSLHFRVPFSNRPSERVSRIGRARFTLKADINDFYGSVYTHSIEWALHTKQLAKAGIKSRGPKTTGAILDELVRNGQDGQTKGIPVGPDTSLILSELILCAIDAQLSSRIPQAAISAIRVVDDFEFAAASRAEAEDVLIAWDGLLNQFDLSLNPRKTEIIEGPTPPETPWRVTLSQLRIRDSTDRVLANDIRSLFSLAFPLAQEYPLDAVLSYAVSRVQGLNLGPQSWKELSNILLATAISEPSSLRFVSRAFRKAALARMDIDKTQIADAMNGICYFHAPLEHGSEVAWALSIIRDMNLSISSDAAARVAIMQDNCSLIILNDLLINSRITGVTPDMSAVIARAEDPEAWKYSDWLLGYEFARNKWAGDAHFTAKSHWKEILDHGVAFYKPIPSGTRTPSASTGSKNGSLSPQIVVPPVPAPATPAPATPAPAPTAPPVPAPTTPASAALTTTASSPQATTDGSGESASETGDDEEYEFDNGQSNADHDNGQPY